jgi:hypothetical protein
VQTVGRDDARKNGGHRSSDEDAPTKKRGWTDEEARMDRRRSADGPTKKRGWTDEEARMK